MSSTSPAAILFSADGYELSAINGSAIPTGTRGILMEGSDGTNSRFITVDTSGRVIVAGTATDNTANSTAKVPVMAAVATTAAPTWTTGNMAPLSVDTSGNLRITGTVTANNASVSATGAAPPASATYAGGSVTTAAPAYTTGQMSALSLTTTGLLRVDGSGVTQPVSGTITANVGTTGGLALDATVAKLTIAQSAALGTNTQALVGGSVTTAAPTYTAGNINPLSLTTAGALRIDGSGSTQPVSGTVTANAGTGNFNVIGIGTDNTTNSTAKLPVLGAVASTAAPTYTSGNMVPLSTDTSGNLRITGTVTANNASVSATGAAPPASATYAGASVTTAAPTYTTGQMSALSMTTAGQLRVDGVYPINATTPTSDANFMAAAVTTAAPAYTTGQLSALSLTTAGSLRVDGSGATQPVSGTVTSNQGTAGTAAQGWFSKITDGTNTAAVKAASTAPAATDPAVVVTISPNTPALAVISDKSSTGTITSVNGATTNTSILTPNTSRISATIYNAANKTMYIALGATASTSAYTIQVFQGSYWELPVSYTGAISAVWASGVSGAALVTELT